YTDTGIVGVYVGTREENLPACIEICVEQIAEIASGKLREGELERAKESLKGRIMLSMESTSNRMSRLGKSLISDTELLTFERIFAEVAGLDAAVDFTTPDAAPANVRAALDQGVSCVVGTTGWDAQPLHDYARERGLRVFVAPNFSLGAVLMMRFAEQAAQYFPRAEIIELHSEAKKDAPSGTAALTAQLIAQSSGGEPVIHSVRLPGLVAHQEVIFGGEGQLLT